MALSTEKLPNRALNGAELKDIICVEFRRMLDNDYQFLENLAYGKVAFTCTLTAELGQPHGKREWKSRTRPDDKGILQGEPPMLPRRKCVCGWDGLESATVGGECPECGKPTQPEDTIVVGLERDVVLENPNLDRIHHDLPIKLQRKHVEMLTPENPLPGEPLPVSEMRSLVTEELRYDPKDAPPVKPPVDRDVSDRERERLGGLGLKKK